MRRGISDLNFYYINKLLQWIVSIDYDKEELDDDEWFMQLLARKGKQIFHDKLCVWLIYQC